ncbi:GH32 C-terminal domain-containing protein [Jeotgalibacillus proteolyticus]|uniref:GH32 C-terminal domain-containing protein n=1 Tax=Jeotgalibacillus proteolyticus TaxID=2082395 RepID=UPI001FD70643|nr:GH32 C-terminal domain-containing protein [Jeotgalibacillus proteolyticus]
MKRKFVLLSIASVIIAAGFGPQEAENFEEESTISDTEYYTEQYRPQYHFSTPQGRLADPNGLIYYNGEYHLFHQKMGTWAHAVSKDMLHWEHLPIALEHDELGQALSGTAVIDWNDTTGFFDGKAGMVAIYTSTANGEEQGIAYSKDNGRTWARYTGNPVIENPGIKDFRDPKVFWHEETEKWVMAVTTDKSVTFYNSPNLINWEYQSKFGVDEQGNEEGSHIAVWETPDLFRLPVDGDKENQKWVLTVSIGDNPVTEGSTNQYFIGEFDGSVFVNDHSPEKIFYTDAGKDFYAAQSFNELAEGDDRRIWIGWMANWRYPYESPTYPWMGSMSIPREVTLQTNQEGEIRLFQEPIRELETIRATEQSFDSFMVEGNHEIEGFSGASYEFEAQISWDDVDEFGIRLRQSEKEETVFGVDVTDETLFLDRSNAGLQTLIDRNGEPFPFGKRFNAPFSSDRKSIKIRGLVDESSVELFIDNGETVFTNLIYTKPTNTGIELYANGGSINVESIDFYHLQSTWRDAPKEGEMERIVVSDELIILPQGETAELTAGAKPDWFIQTEPFQWTADNEGIIEIHELNDKTISVKGLKPGTTTVTVREPNGISTKKVTIRVTDSSTDYLFGWGPSPFNRAIDGKWDVFGQSTINSFLSFSQVWSRIYREELLTGDFTLSADIKWIKQGSEGFPKYGIALEDQDSNSLFAFLNKDINKLETFAETSSESGWEGVDLPAAIDLAEPQNLKIERKENLFTFYVNGVEVYKRIVEMDDTLTAGAITENVEARYTNFTVEPAFKKYRLDDLIEAAETSSELSKGVKQSSLAHLKNAQKHFEKAQQLYENKKVVQANKEEVKGYEKIEQFSSHLQKSKENQKAKDLIKMAVYIINHQTES